MQHVDDLADILTRDAALREFEGGLDQGKDEAFGPIAKHAEIAAFDPEQCVVDVTRHDTVAADNLADPALHAMEAVLIAPERIVGIKANGRDRMPPRPGPVLLSPNSFVYRSPSRSASL